MLVPVGQMNLIVQMSSALRSPFQILHRKRIARRRHCGGEEGERRRWWSVQRQRQLGVPRRGSAITRGFLYSDLGGGDGGGGRGAAAAQSFGEARRGGTRALLN